MKLIEAWVARGRPIVVDSPQGGARYTAALFVVPTGVVFFDIGWDQSSGHPFHYLEGEVPSGDPPWELAGAKLRPLEEVDDGAIMDMLAWRAYLASSEGAFAASKENQLRALKNFCEEMDISVDQ